MQYKALENAIEFAIQEARFAKIEDPENAGNLELIIMLLEAALTRTAF